MGAKQSSPTAANGRTRAYSGGDLPSSSSSSSTNGRAAGGGRAAHSAAAPAPHAAPGGSAAAAAAPGGAAGSAPRSRSLGAAAAAAAASSSAGSRAAQPAFSIPHSSGPYGSQDSVSSTPEEGGRERAPGGGGSGGPRLVIGSLPAHLSPHLFGGFKCPVCSKFVSSDEMDLHLVMCLTKPRITYNEDVLSKDTGECAICLEELQQGDTIARLPCLCIYHKGCIDEWFEVNRSCPEHPSD
ncbi:E3 ubiquitin-protein ligase ZNRF2 [Aythya fuligula]|uniref:RING-type E3 ubiquitin transferase n=1 Tax=Aythya fuligula TaxID=219594 RepID=A0A6J3CKM9_AYTFU|nr:E3 ubiquitin-protein ligase ZNRF2 [Aythya fuligula]